MINLETCYDFQWFIPCLIEILQIFLVFSCCQLCLTQTFSDLLLCNQWPLKWDSPSKGVYIWNLSLPKYHPRFQMMNFRQAYILDCWRYLSIWFFTQTIDNALCKAVSNYNFHRNKEHQRGIHFLGEDKLPRLPGN